MNNRITEEGILFFSVIKWVSLATIVGAIVGASSTLFLKILHWSVDYGHQYPKFFYFLPIALFLSSIIIKYSAPDAKGHGTEKVIEAIHKQSGKIKAAVVPVKLVATVITIAAGGSVGKEGPCAQIGAGLASTFSGILNFSARDRKKLVVCGISAGFAAVFGTPLAGSIFGVEVLFVGGILYDVLLPSLIAGITSYHIANAMGIEHFYHKLNFVPVFSETFFLLVVFSGIVFGICSVLLIDLLNFCERLSDRIKIWEPLKGLIGGVILIILTLIFSTQYLGLGLDTIDACLTGEKVVWYSFIVKGLFTSITLSFGGSGGILTPIFFIGATAGLVFGQILGLSTATFSAIGMVSVLAGAANTPIAASIMAIELFGPKIAPYATVACAISFLMTGYRSVYPSQVLSINKSSSIPVEIGKELENIEATFDPSSKKLILSMLLISNKIKEITYKGYKGLHIEDHLKGKK